jgi:cytochrome c oxidase cbb3-type subunit III
MKILAQSTASYSQQELLLFGLTIAVIVISLLVLFLAINIMSAMYGLLLQKEHPEQVGKISVWGYLWQNLDRQWTNAIPLEKENTVMLDHNYDGIRELDNHLPPWWVYLFYITIVFSAVYMLNYHVFGWQDLPEGEYQAELVYAEEQKKLFASSINEENVKASKDAKELTVGKEVFVKECKMCHGEKGEGVIGPNLTDAYWLYGGSVNDIFKTIKYGAKNGMQPWEKKLSPSQIKAVSSYILTLQGTNPPNAKEPQGQKFVAKN